MPKNTQKYRRTQSKTGANDTPEISAAVGFVLAVDAGQLPSQETLKNLAASLRKIPASGKQLHQVAARRIVAAVDNHQVPTQADLARVAAALHDMFGGTRHPPDIKNPKDTAQNDIWGADIGFGRKRGRQPLYGITPSDVVSAYIEKQRRALGGHRGALEQAKRMVARDFVDLTGTDVERQIDYYWSDGRTTVEHLSDEDLERILEPYKVD